jgi:hypothetical protein
MDTAGFLVVACVSKTLSVKSEKRQVSKQKHGGDSYSCSGGNNLPGIGATNAR